MSPKPPGKGHSHKHSGTPKHQPGPKHHPQHHPQPHGGPPPPPVHVKAHPHHHPKPRGLSPGWEVACCSAEAVGLLLGWGHDEVLALYWRTVTDPDSGASILDTLEAARCWPHPLASMAALPSARAASLLVPDVSALSHSARSGREPCYQGADAQRLATYHTGMILGVELPGPHAIAVTPDGTWWSWGQPFHPCEWPELVVEEAWALWQ